MYSIKSFQVISIFRAEIGQKMSKKTDNSVLSVNCPPKYRDFGVNFRLVSPTVHWKTYHSLKTHFADASES